MPSRTKKSSLKKNVCCHYCRKKLQICEHLYCTGECRKAFCVECIESLGELINVDKDKDTWTCPCCRNKCCCCFEVCPRENNVKHKHCFTYGRTQKRHKKKQPKWTKTRRAAHPFEKIEFCNFGCPNGIFVELCNDKNTPHSPIIDDHSVSSCTTPSSESQEFMEIDQEEKFDNIMMVHNGQFVMIDSSSLPLRDVMKRFSQTTIPSDFCIQQEQILQNIQRLKVDNEGESTTTIRQSSDTLMAAYGLLQLLDKDEKSDQSCQLKSHIWEIPFDPTFPGKRIPVIPVARRPKKLYTLFEIK